MLNNKRFIAQINFPLAYFVNISIMVLARNASIFLLRLLLYLNFSGMSLYE